ncbi:hypothetical protein ACEUCJ_15100 [Aeromonas rivipollensis]|uniref:hypothetical protein n=1 Tax=Aeromonas rivipollensis TaxID=948519 RepID=UPI0038D22417
MSDLNSVHLLFFQAVAVNGQDMPIRHLAGGTYIEHTNLDGPQLLLTISDADAALRDNGGLVEGAELTVKMGDPDGRGDVYFSSKFIVCSADAHGDHLMVEAIEAGVYRAKQPATKPQFYPGLTAKQIIEKVLPGYKLDMPANETKFTYHITAGATPSSVLRLLERDMGACLWVARGVVHCIPYQAMMQRSPKDAAILFEYRQQKSDHPIMAYTPLGVNTPADRAVRRNYFVWDTVKGMIQGKADRDAPPSILTGVDATALEAASRRLDPCLLANVMGNGRYAAGLTVGIRLHRFDRESVVDESVPTSQVIMTVSHTQTSNNYQCKITTGIPR